METVLMEDSLLTELGKRGGRVKKDELYCALTSGERPSDMLLANISDALRQLERGRRIRYEGDYVVANQNQTAPKGAFFYLTDGSAER